jgi:aspartyl-tRNA(Asn)/glutamyl-tRNA(Gln) amidotransferase subunit A
VISLLTAGIEELTSLYAKRGVSPVEVTRSCLDRIATLNPTLHAYTTVFEETALEHAREAERRWRTPASCGPLCGIPVSVKDVYQTVDGPTTWGAKALAEYRPSEDATVVSKLRAAGAILLGKTNVDTYPYDGGLDGPRLLGPTRNPWDPERTAGRTSGGSAASVAALLDHGSIGSDTTGSIRIPAAWCGVVGFKPTFGRVSNHGVFPYSESFDHAGPIARSVPDAAALLQAIAGHDPLDPHSSQAPVPDYVRLLASDVNGTRVGVPADSTRQDHAPDVIRAFYEALGVLRAAGMRTREVELPGLNEPHWIYIMSVEENTALIETRGSRPIPHDPVVAHLLDRVAAGRHRLQQQGRQVQHALQRAYRDVFRDVDLIAMPTVPITAPRFDEHSPWQVVAQNVRMFSFVGIPAITLPCGFASNGMPIGLQLAGRPFDDEGVLRTAFAYERRASWRRHPRLDVS